MHFISRLQAMWRELVVGETCDGRSQSGDLQRMRRRAAIDACASAFFEQHGPERRAGVMDQVARLFFAFLAIFYLMVAKPQ
jgi:hypothetical protein